MSPPPYRPAPPPASHRLLRGAGVALTLLGLGLAPSVAGAAAQSTKQRRTTTHVVYPGQTAGMVAKRYQISVDELLVANRLTRRDILRPGQRLVIPAPGAPPPPALPAPSPATKKAPEDSKPRAEAEGKPAARATARPATLPASNKGAAGPSKPESFRRLPKRRGFVDLTSTTDHYTGYVFDRRGRLTARARKGLSRVFASWRTGQEHEMDARLLKLLVQVSDYFGGRPLRIVSGFRPRSPVQFTPHSRHNLGRAIDFAVIGVPNEVLRDYVRRFAGVGVGYYPNSSFIHMDVREGSAYWVDFAGPGEAPRYATRGGRDPGPAVRRVSAPSAEEESNDDDGPSEQAAVTASATAAGTPKD